MSEKSLTELEWKKFSKGRNLKDAAFVKALAELEKAEKAKDFEAQLKALDEIEKQADVLRKANKAEKEVTSYLDDVDKGVSKDRKLAEFEARKAKKAAEEAAESGDEDETPELLTTKMIPLMRQVRKGDTMQVLIAMAGKDTCVFVSRKPIGPPRRKLLTTYLGTTAGVKFVPGEVIWEENANTFVMRTQAAGLAKKVKAALLAQTEQRYKVRVRGEDPNDIDDDGEATEQAELGDESKESSSEEGGSATQTQVAPELAQAAGPAAKSGEPARDRAAEFELALGEWKTARTAAIGVLKALAKEAAELRDPESAQAIIEVQAVVKQLSAEPRSAQQVLEPTRWVQDDDVVIDVCNLEQDIRTPLLRALAALQKSVADA